MSTSETETTCRLCGLSSEPSTHIFERLACVNMLQYKIKQLLDIAVGRSDNLPHSVCLLCVYKLDSFWCFKNACQQVQIKLRKLRGLNESNYADCNRLQIESVPSINMMVTSGFKTHENDSSTSRPSHEKELDLQSPSTSKSSISKNLVECSDDVSKQKSTFTYIDSASLPLAVNLEKDYHNQLGEQTISNSHLHSVSNDRPSETTFIHTTGVDNCISDDEDNDGIIQEDDSMSFASEENVNVSVDISSSDMNSALSESTGQSLADSNCQKMNESTSVCEGVENFEVNSPRCVTSIVKVTGDNVCSNTSSNEQEQNGKNTEISSLSASTGLEIAPCFEGHFYRMETNNNSDLLCNRIPYLIVESKMGTKHMIYTISPDLSKFDNEHNNYMFDTDTVYLKLETFDLNTPNVVRSLIKWLNNLMKGELSLMPYYFSWLDSKNKLNLGFKCVICKLVIHGSSKQFVMNHIADHLLWICPVCGRFFRSVQNFHCHLRQWQHESPTFECSTCGENFGSDFEKYKVHKRGHYKFECLACRFECIDQEEWLKHLKKDRSRTESCSADCCLFYESIDEFRNHVSALATLGGYVCGACGMAYHCEEYLRLHLRVLGLGHGSKTSCEAELPRLASSENEATNFQKKLDRLKNSDDLTHYDTLKKILANEIDSKEFQTFSVAVGGKVFTGFMCFKCNKILATEKKFKAHIGNHLMMTCQCKRYFSRIGRLRNHFKKCSFKRRRCVSCRNDVWLNTSKEYIEHLSLHQKRTICIYCQKVWPNPQKLERHIESFHNTENEKHWFCEHCNETLLVTSYRRVETFKLNHFKERHPDKLESFICDICGKTFIAKNPLTAHMKEHLPKKNNDPFICGYCSKAFPTKCALIPHIRQHMNEKNFKCDICGKAFIRKTSLYKHKLDMHSVKKHVCNVCEKRFTYPSALRDHMKRAHNFIRLVKSGSPRKVRSPHCLSAETQDARPV